jgi:hypothetical protein
MTVPETAMAVAKTAPCEVMIEDIVFGERKKRKERFGGKLRKVKECVCSLISTAAKKSENIYILV